MVYLVLIMIFQNSQPKYTVTPLYQLIAMLGVISIKCFSLFVVIFIVIFG